MAGSKYVFGAVLLVGAAVYLGGNGGLSQRTTHAMGRLAIDTQKCIENRIQYLNLTLKCESSVTFSDFRKLDMRADNRARSTGGGSKWIAVNP